MFRRTLHRIADCSRSLTTKYVPVGYQLSAIGRATVSPTALPLRAEQTSRSGARRCPKPQGRVLAIYASLPRYPGPAAQNPGGELCAADGWSVQSTAPFRARNLQNPLSFATTVRASTR